MPVLAQFARDSAKLGIRAENKVLFAVERERETN